MNPNIDPVLHVWHWQIPLYLFLGGLAAGLLFFAAFYVIRGKEDRFATAVKVAPILAPIAIALGLVALMLDLKNPLYSWQLYTTVRLSSPMSWGAWTLMFIMPLSIIWVVIYFKDVFPQIPVFKGFMGTVQHWVIDHFEAEPKKLNWNWKYQWARDLEAFFIKNKLPIAWVMVVLAVILGVYTGILLSAFNARPLWNTSILGPLFLTSGLSTAAATIMWMSNSHEEQKRFSQIDLLLIVIELFFITHLFMGFLSSSAVQVGSAGLFFGGDFTTTFWLFVVVMGLVIPAVLEVLELKGYRIHVALPAFLILMGGLLFRFVMVEAGQITRYLY